MNRVRVLIAHKMHKSVAKVVSYNRLEMASQLLITSFMQKQKKPLVLKPNTQLKELTVTELDKVVGGGSIPRLNGSGGVGTNGTRLVNEGDIS